MKKFSSIENTNTINNLNENLNVFSSMEHFKSDIGSLKQDLSDLLGEHYINTSVTFSSDKIINNFLSVPFRSNTGHICFILSFSATTIDNLKDLNLIRSLLKIVDDEVKTKKAKLIHYRFQYDGSDESPGDGDDLQVRLSYNISNIVDYSILEEKLYKDLKIRLGDKYQILDERDSRYRGGFLFKDSEGNPVNKIVNRSGMDEILKAYMDIGFDINKLTLLGSNGPLIVAVSVHLLISKYYPELNKI